MKIQIIVIDDHNAFQEKVLAKREALSWEGANEDFGKLEREFKEAEEVEKCKACGKEYVVGSDDNGNWYCAEHLDNLKDT